MHDPTPRLRVRLAATLFAAALCGQLAGAQSEQQLPYPVTSALVANDGAEAAVVLSFPVVVEGATSLRLHFSEVLLAGDDAHATGSLLRMTSLYDGAVQELEAVHVDQWYRTSAYFNGDTVLVEVLAQPGTGGNRVALEQVTVGPILAQGRLEDLTCGPTDERVPSNDPRTARIGGSSCTAFIIDDCSSCFLTNGDCLRGGGGGSGTVVMFNVPPSTSSGAPQFPSPVHQYTIDSNSIQAENNFVGDWSYFGTFPNSLTGRIPFQAYGARYTTELSPSFNASEGLRVTGYGFDDTPPQRSWTQQTEVGAWVSFDGTTLEYATDTNVGSEGSAVVHEPTGDAIGIHTEWCGTSGSGLSTGIALSSPSLQAALANPKGVCDDFACGRVGVSYCTSNGASISASGSSRISVNNLLLSARGLPVGATGLFIYSRSQQATPFGNGTLCIGPSTVYRIQPSVTASVAGSIDKLVSYSTLPAAGKIQPGDTWHFQAWFRDGSASFDLTDAVQIDFVP